MERLFTNITNAGATAAQNENIMHTGCYAGERENFMRENLFMTETTMAPVKIALDHGWSSIKGEHIFMETSVVPVDYTPLTNHGLLEYKGQKYIVGQGRLGKQATKTENENYFLLTLAELQRSFSIREKHKQSMWNYMQECHLHCLVPRERNFVIICGIRKEFLLPLKEFIIQSLLIR